VSRSILPKLQTENSVKRTRLPCESRSTFPALVSYIAGKPMGDSVEVFHFDDDRPNFESLIKENGFRHWLASDLREALGYDHMQPVLKAVNKAMAACAQLNVPIPDNFEQTKTPAGEKDWKLSRFACYLTVMNGDSNNRRVAEAQAYFVTIAEAFQQYVQEADGVERVLIRGELSERERSLSASAFRQGVQNYAFFQNAGYRGMYNLDLNQIRRRKGVPVDRSPLDFMGKAELAANLFRVTQTEQRIENENIRGQAPLENAAHYVGREVRKTMIAVGGTAPEALPSACDIKDVRKDLKHTHKQYAKIDGKPRRLGK